MRLPPGNGSWSQGKVVQDDVNEINQRFDDLDKDDDGTLESSEVLRTTI